MMVKETNQKRPTANKRASECLDQEAYYGQNDVQRCNVSREHRSQVALATVTSGENACGNLNSQKQNAWPRKMLTRQQKYTFVKDNLQYWPAFISPLPSPHLLGEKSLLQTCIGKM
jgi:uncharacterized protein with NAD-binding domain and iron-sulfur cluster